MFRTILAVAFAAGLAAAPSFAPAADKKDDVKTFTGKLVCAKCTLNAAPDCVHALKVKDGKKDVIYYVDDSNANHPDVCPAGTELDAKVTGKLVEKDGKKTITNAKVEIK